MNYCLLGVFYKEYKEFNVSTFSYAKVMLHKETKFSHKIADELLIRIYQCMKVNTRTNEILNQQSKFYPWLH